MLLWPCQVLKSREAALCLAPLCAHGWTWLIDSVRDLLLFVLWVAYGTVLPFLSCGVHDHGVTIGLAPRGVVQTTIPASAKYINSSASTPGLGFRV